MNFADLSCFKCTKKCNDCDFFVKNKCIHIINGHYPYEWDAKDKEDFNQSISLPTRTLRLFRVDHE